MVLDSSFHWNPCAKTTASGVWFSLTWLTHIKSVVDNYDLTKQLLLEWSLSASQLLATSNTNIRQYCKTLHQEVPDCHTYGASLNEVTNFERTLPMRKMYVIRKWPSNKMLNNKYYLMRYHVHKVCDLQIPFQLDWNTEEFTIINN